MAQIDQSLKTTLKAMRPEGMEKLAAKCKASAEKMFKGANLITEAGKAFAAGDFTEGYVKLNEADIFMAKK